MVAENKKKQVQIVGSYKVLKQAVRVNFDGLLLNLDMGGDGSRFACSGGWIQNEQLFFLSFGQRKSFLKSTHLPRRTDYRMMLLLSLMSLKAFCIIYH